MVVVVVRENTFDLDGKPDVEITGVFHGFKDEDEALQWVDNIRAEWKVNPNCIWSILETTSKTEMI